MATQQTLVGMGGEEPGLYDFGSGVVTFSQNNRHGRSAPSLGELRNGLSGGNSNSWKNDTNFFNSSGGIQYWTVPKTGTYRIETYGPRGGQSFSNYQGGYGTRMRGDFDLTSGDTIKILVGQTGASSYGGGGMTAVATNSNTPLIVSGGGNAHSPWNNQTSNATTSSNGQNNTNGTTSGGSGGNAGYSNSGAWGGAGFYQSSTGNANCGTAPYSFTNNGQGGYTCNGDGGFGGGSGTDGCCYGASGAGAGYSGGGGGTPGGGGGGSYNNGSNQSNGGNGSQNSKVEITQL